MAWARPSKYNTKRYPEIMSSTSKKTMVRKRNVIQTKYDFHQTATLVNKFLPMNQVSTKRTLGDCFTEFF